MYIVLIYSSTLDTVHFAHLRGRRVWRYQMGNHNPYNEEEQTTQWPKEKVQKDKQRSSKHTHKNINVNLVTNPMISHEWGKDRGVFTTIGTYPRSLWLEKIFKFCTRTKNCLIRMKSGRTFSRYDLNQTIGKPNNLKVCGRRKPRCRSESVYLSLL